MKDNQKNRRVTDLDRLQIETARKVYQSYNMAFGACMFMGIIFFLFSIFNDTFLIAGAIIFHAAITKFVGKPIN